MISNRIRNFAVFKIESSREIQPSPEDFTNLDLPIALSNTKYSAIIQLR
jgi:hypothetical protein